MREVLLADLRHNRASWCWTLVALSVSATAFGAVFGSGATVAAAIARSGNDRMALELQSLISVLLTFIGITACAVIATSTRLVTISQLRGYALWKVLGMRGRTIRRIVLCQLAVLGVLAGSIGAVLSPLATAAYISTWSETGLPVTGPLGFSPMVPFATIALTCCFSVVGGWGPARRAARVDELQALREAVLPRARVTKGVLLTTLFLLFLCGMCFSAGVSDGINSRGEPDSVVAAMLMLLAATLTFSVKTVPVFLLAWTAPLPRDWAAWHLARARVRQRSAQTISATLPYALALSLIGTLYGSVAAAGVAVNGVGMLLGLVVPITVAGGMGTVAMTALQRRADTEVLHLVGASPRVIATASVLEGAAYGVTGAVIGWAFTLGSTLVGALLLGVPLRSGLGHLPWPMLLVMTACAVVVPALCALLAGGRQTK